MAHQGKLKTLLESIPLGIPYATPPSFTSEVRLQVFLELVFADVGFERFYHN